MQIFMRRFWFSLVSLLILAAPLQAQTIFPALYNVTGVASWDVLNVRTQPSAKGQKIGGFGPNEKDIEVMALSADGKWGRVNTGEQAGWASMKFLTRQAGQTEADWRDDFAPMKLSCSGNEPFWSLTLRPDRKLVYSSLNLSNGADLVGGFETVRKAHYAKRGFYGWLDDATLGFTGVITNERCGDGMSDRDYGLSIDLVQTDETGAALVTGCCVISP